ncbi:MAG: hypothetical protein EA351_00890 [Gemmatimonadales bacterium]|nr:MAG: hypothetical protein EA351_00890 [Gemmatimonadales bacterium]
MNTNTLSKIGRTPARGSVFASPRAIGAGLLVLGLLGGSVSSGHSIDSHTKGGAEVIFVEVSHDSGVYHVRSSAHFSAPPASVWAVLTDYEHLTSISEIVVESRLLEEFAEDGSLRLHTLLRGCVSFFCRNVVRVEQLSSVWEREIVALVEPEHSDLKEGFTEWRFYPLEDGGTRVDLEMQVVPDFWIPPLIGPRAMRRRLLQDGTDAVGKIEKLALEIGASGALGSGN